MANSALARLRDGELSLGVILRQARSVEIAVIMKTAGFDWLFLDLEHNSMSIETAGEICVAALGTGIAPVVRVPQGQFWLATRALDGGALGIVMPHIDTPEQAREVVRELRYPPLGRRSISSMQVHAGFQAVPVDDLVARLEPEFLVAVMLETEEAIDNCEAIAAVDGIDVIMIGANDLCLGMGIPGQVDHPRAVRCFERVTAACRAAGRWAGMGGVHRPVDLPRYIGMGMRFILSGNDAGLLIAAGRERTALLRTML